MRSREDTIISGGSINMMWAHVPELEKQLDPQLISLTMQCMQWLSSQTVHSPDWTQPLLTYSSSASHVSGNQSSTAATPPKPCGDKHLRFHGCHALSRQGCSF